MATQLEQLVDQVRAAGGTPGEIVIGRAAVSKLFADIKPHVGSRPLPWMKVVYHGEVKGVPMRISDMAPPHSLALMPRNYRSIEEVLNAWRIVK